MSGSQPLRDEDPVARATHRQRAAARPDGSAWVTASAGSGKTKVLTDRVLTLLLSGAAPERLLCLTFTKAAAANMRNRLAERLAEWATADDPTLTEALDGLVEGRVDDETRARARRLFARVLDAPGGIRIQTIHAFCQSILGRFPLEAGVPPNFQLLDERSAGEMLREAREEVLSRLDEVPALEEAMDRLVSMADEETLNGLVNDLLGERARLIPRLERFGLAAALREICEVLEVEPEETEEDVWAAACADGAFDGEGLRRAAEAMRSGAKTDQESSAIVERWASGSPEERQGLLGGDTMGPYQTIFLTQKGEVRSRFPSAGTKSADPSAEGILHAEAERILAVRAHAASVRLAGATAALLEFAYAILSVYERLKRMRGVLDYDDLILCTRRLLAQEGGAGWVLYKLDGGLEHILIDEAQDTNPEQWQVVRDLAEEFFAGLGRHETTRTIFAVGDAKQSIYRFQRADPAMFREMRAHFEARASDAGQNFEKVTLDVSFRSVAAVLRAVDSVFQNTEAQQGLLLAENRVQHLASRRGHAGLVEVWPVVAAEEAPSLEPWTAPTTRSREQPPQQRLADLLARKIHRWTTDPAGADDPEARLEARGRRMQPGDVLVLVRRRNAFLYALVRALKQLNVPVTGVDRMLLNDQLAIMDLVALGRFLLMPEDDLTLATVLRSPLAGLSDDDLFELAHGRGERSLWARLREKAGERPVFAAAEEFLSELLGRADYTPPYELFANLLGPGGGRRRLLQRLGPEAQDPIDEFLEAALTYEAEHAASLEGFLHWLDQGEQEVKRELEAAGKAVRVMTVHGAKGLQAPVVFLPDTTDTPRSRTTLFWMAEDRDGSALPVWSPSKALDDPRTDAAREAVDEAEMDEYRRLLYVAMTRAEDRLYICGWLTRNRKAPAKGSWYDLAVRGLGESAEAVDFDFSGVLGPENAWSGPGLRRCEDQEAKPEADHADGEPVPEIAGPAPAWLSSPAPEEPAPPRPLAPSRPASGEPPVTSPLAGDEESRFQRGLIIHRLLEFLPELPAERRRQAGQRYLARPVHGLDEQTQEAILEETLAVMEDPALAPVFGPGSLAEVPVSGTIGKGATAQVVSGQIDRLAVTAEAVLVVDYKTNRPAPAAEADVSAAYLGQMAAYRAILADIYPDRRIDCFLLWTEAPRLMQLSHETLAGHAP